MKKISKKAMVAMAKGKDSFVYRVAELGPHDLHEDTICYEIITDDILGVKVNLDTNGYEFITEYSEDIENEVWPEYSKKWYLTKKEANLALKKIAKYSIIDKDSGFRRGYNKSKKEITKEMEEVYGNEKE